MSEDSFLREVEDELRSDRVRQFWRRFAPVVIGVAILIIVAVAGNELWSWWRSSQANAASERFYAAQDLATAGDTDGAIAAFQAIAADGPSGYATLARFREASLLGQNGDTQGALALYDALASNAPEPNLRELALVLGAYLLVDAGDVAAVQTRLAGIVDGTGAMRLPALEALGLAQYDAGDVDAARQSFETLTAEAGASQDLQGRALLYLEVINADTGAQANVGTPLSGLDGLPVDPNFEDLATELVAPASESAGLTVEGAATPAAEDAAPLVEDAAPAAEEAPVVVEDEPAAEEPVITEPEPVAPENAPAEPAAPAPAAQ